MASLSAVLAAQGVSLVGNAMTYLAVPWFVLQVTGSATQTGLAAAAAFLPALLSMSFGGVLIDRLGHRTASIGADLLSAVAVGLIPLLRLAGLLSLPLLLVLVFLAAAFDAPANTAKHSLIPTLAEPSGVSLVRASSVLDIVERAARMVGAPLAGLLIAAIGPTNVLFVDAATFVVAAAIISLSGAPSRPAGQPAGRVPFLAGLREGLGFLWSDPLLRVVMVMVAMTNLLDVGYVTVVLPVYGDRVLSGAASVGVLIGTSALAAVAGGLVFGAVAHRLPRRGLFTTVVVLVGLPRCLVLAAEPGFVLVLAVVATTGFCSGMINPILSTAQFTRIPENLRGRVLGAMAAGAYGVVPLGPVIAGGLLAAFSLTTTLLIFAAVYALIAATMLPLSAWRDIVGRPHATAAA
jgi:MFS family permease